MKDCSDFYNGGKIGFKVNTNEFELQCFRDTGHSISMGVKKEEPNLNGILFDLVEAMSVLNEYKGFRGDPSIFIGMTKQWERAWNFGVRCGYTHIPINRVQDSQEEWEEDLNDWFRSLTNPDMPTIVDGGVNFTGDDFDADDDEFCCHIWRATFWHGDHPLAGQLMGIMNMIDRVGVMVDGATIQLED